MDKHEWASVTDAGGSQGEIMSVQDRKEKNPQDSLNAGRIQLDHWRIMQSDIKQLKLFIQDQYRLQVTDPAKERQDDWSKLLEQQSKELWTN